MIEITRLVKSGGPLTKRISIDVNGLLHSDGSACVMSSGRAQRARFDSLYTFASTIADLGPSEAIALGALRHDLPDQVEIETKARLNTLSGSATLPLIARTSDYIIYQPNRAALALIDIDTKGMSIAVKERITTLGGYWHALVSVLPDLERAARVLRPSTTTEISRADTGEALPGSAGMHVYLLVKDGLDIERFLRTLHACCWLRGLGCMMVGAGGQLLERSLVDRMVYAPERLVFAAAPILEPPLVQDQASRKPEVIDGHPFDTRAACLDPTIVEKARLRDLRVAEVRRLAPDAEKAKSQFIQRQAIRLADRTGCSLAAARNVAERQTSGILLPDVALPLDTPEFDGVTVRDVLTDPERFVGATLADPLEGLDYGRCKAKIMRRKDGSCWIKSFAHGHTTYELKHDAASMEIAIRSGDPTEALDRFVRLLLVVDLTPTEEQRLRDLTSELSGIKARALGAKVKAAREQQTQERAQETRNSHADESRDKRLRLSVPLSDGERLPVLRMLDEVLNNTGEEVPPIRDIDGHPVEVRCRPPVALHELSADGSNAAEPEKSRLPPPALPLLTRHTKYTLSHEIERHIAFAARSRTGRSAKWRCRPSSSSTILPIEIPLCRESRLF
jgi:hypothetical protein